MTTTDTTFFTNEEWQSLLDRFKITLPNNTKFFDVLVGYFRTSGFFQLYDALEKVEKIRILVWLNVDKTILEVIETSKKKATAEIKDHYSLELEREFEKNEDKQEVEEWIQKFIEFIESWKLEIRVYPNEPIHAKIYIIRKDAEKDQENYGKVITWSSNFSFNGLKGNMEFNVELKDKRDVDYALEKFENLWKDGVDVSLQYVDTVKNKTWMNDEITPYYLYLKFLYEYFGNRINDDKNELDMVYTPDWFKKLKYQEDAVIEAIDKLNKYNGVFLADVVWLWKTFISALLGQQLRWWILVICPPHLQDYWKETFFDFGIRSFEVESLGKLEHIIEKWHEKYKYVYIDEVHRFRNEDTQSYELLRAICMDKKVILVSATPFNNSFKDLAALISLFQIPRDSNIPWITNLQLFFANKENKLKKIDKKTHYNEYLDLLKESSDDIRNKVLKHLMIRRTRWEIETYFEQDMTQQWLSFPKVSKPNKVLYEFDDKLDKIFTETLNTIVWLTYARYTPALYVKEWVSVEQVQKIWQKNLKWFMKSLIVKRLESSFFAFKNTLQRMVESYQKFIEMYDKWTVYISKKVDVYELLDDDFGKLLELVEKWTVIEYKKNDFENNDEKNFEEDLKNDLDLLESLLEKRKNINVDPKIDEFKELLETSILKSKKMIIFSESKETVDYLKNSLSNIYPNQVFWFSSNSSGEDKEKIKRNFDPKSKKPEDDIRILITTDVLAEWINLHKSNIIINYDIPWNPTRILQRAGRINRVGTKHTDIHIYNFFPTKQSNDQLQLEENVKSKMQAFISLLGEDAKHLTESEEIENHRLFASNLYNQINSAEFVAGEDKESVENSELKYLNIIRQIRDKDKPLYETIKRLPKKSRSSKQLSNQKESLLTFFKKGDYLKMYFANWDLSQEIDFWLTAKLLESSSDDKKQNINKALFYKLLQKNKDQFDEDINKEIIEEQSPKKWGKSNEKTIIWYINAILKNGSMVDQEEMFFRHILLSLEDGIFPKKTLKKVKIEMDELFPFDNPTKVYKKIQEIIPDEFLNTKKNQKNKEEENIEVILNQYII